MPSRKGGSSGEHQQPLKVTPRCYHDSAGLPLRSCRRGVVAYRELMGNSPNVCVQKPQCRPTHRGSIPAPLPFLTPSSSSSALQSQHGRGRDARSALRGGLILSSQPARKRGTNRSRGFEPVKEEAAGVFPVNPECLEAAVAGASPSCVCADSVQMD